MLPTISKCVDSDREFLFYGFDEGAICAFELYMESERLEGHLAIGEYPSEFGPIYVISMSLNRAVEVFREYWNMAKKNTENFIVFRNFNGEEDSEDEYRGD